MSSWKRGAFVCSRNSSSSMQGSILGKKIRKLRREQGYDLDQLADITHVEKNVLWAIENRPTNPPQEVISKLAQGLGVEESYLTDHTAYVAEMAQQKERDQRLIDDLVSSFMERKAL